MLSHKDKALEDMDFFESTEFEKFMLKKVLAASKAGMTDRVIEQLQFLLSLIREQKKTAQELGRTNFNDGVTVNLGGEDIPEPTDEDEETND